MPVDRDYVFLLNAYDISPGSYTPKVSTMLDFNVWTFNSRAFPGTDPMVARLGERVRIRVGNLTMTNHPIHLHGHEFVVAGTDGGWTPPASRWPEVTTDIAVGQMRAIEFTAAAAGDWAFHCHKSHHTMNAMSHDVPTTLGVESGGSRPADHLAGAGLYVDGKHWGHGRHRRLDGRDADAHAPAGKHLADDDGHRSVRRDGDGRHVHRHENSPGSGPPRLSRSRLVPGAGRQRRLPLGGRGAAGGARRLMKLNACAKPLAPIEAVPAIDEQAVPGNAERE